MAARELPPSRQAEFTFDPEHVKSADEVSPDSMRLVWMVLTLVRRRSITYERYYGMFDRGSRTYKRDLRKVRDLGLRFGFTLAKRGGGYELATLDDDGARRAPAPENGGADALLAVVDALGELVAREIGAIVDVDAVRPDRFLRIALPQLVAQSAVADVYRTLREAWQRRARVRFRYAGAGSSSARERTVEPYLVTFVAGRYYLVGFDVEPRRGGWRQFSLDRIVGPVARAGTFQPRAVPVEYRGENAIGLFKTRRPVEVAIRLSPRIAAAVTARRWQRDQRVDGHADGSATIAFLVHDFGEAVRWAFSFGNEARVVGPPEAVAYALTLVEQMRGAYERAAGERSVAV